MFISDALRRVHERLSTHKGIDPCTVYETEPTAFHNSDALDAASSIELYAEYGHPILVAKQASSGVARRKFAVGFPCVRDRLLYVREVGCVFWVGGQLRGQRVQRWLSSPRSGA